MSTSNNYLCPKHRTRAKSSVAGYVCLSLVINVNLGSVSGLGGTLCVHTKELKIPMGVSKERYLIIFAVFQRGLVEPVSVKVKARESSPSCESLELPG